MLINTLDDQQISFPIVLLQKFRKSPIQGIPINQSDNQRSKTVQKIAIESGLLNRTIEFLQVLQFQEHTIIPKPVPNGKLETFLSETEANFLKSLKALERQQVLKLADELGIEHLSNLMLASFACDFIGCTTLEFLKKQNINIEYNNELEKEIQQHYPQIIKGVFQS